MTISQFVTPRNDDVEVMREEDDEGGGAGR